MIGFAFTIIIFANDSILIAVFFTAILVGWSKKRALKIKPLKQIRFGRIDVTQ